MITPFARRFTCAVAFAACALFSAIAGNPKDFPSDSASHHPSAAANQKWLTDLASSDPRKVMNALDDIEEKAPADTNVLFAVRKLLPDPRPSVRQKAARVLGTLHAPVGHDDLKAICVMLKSYDQREADSALKALRGLNAAQAIPDITPLLKSPHPLLVRDACRTLAVLGNKDQIPLIEPLLQHTDKDVRKDAQTAIATLQTKP